MNLQTKSNGRKSSAPASNVISITDAHKISYGSSKQALATYICNEDRKERRTLRIHSLHTLCGQRNTTAEFHRLNAEFYCNCNPLPAGRSGLVFGHICTLHEQELSLAEGLTVKIL